MKNIIAVLLCLIFVFSVVACTNPDDTMTTTSGSESPSVEQEKEENKKEENKNDENKNDEENKVTTTPNNGSNSGMGNSNSEKPNPDLDINDGEGDKGNDYGPLKPMD